MNSPLNLSGRLLSFVGVVAFWGAHAGVRAEVIAEYKAPADPSLPEFGWTATGRAGGGIEVETPEPAWRIAPKEGAALNYTWAAAETLLPDAFSKGWRFSARVRLDASTNKPVNRYVVALGVENAEKKEAFILWVYTDEAGENLIAQLNKKTVALPGLAVDEFHRYAVTYRPGSDSAQLEVDGEVVAEDVNAAPTERWYLRWGHQSVNGRGSAEWASVKFETLAQ